MVDPEIAALEAELRTAQLGGDVAALDRLIAEDLLFIGPDGTPATKAQDLAAYRDRVMIVSTHEPEELRVRRIGSDVAMVVLRARMAGSYAGAPFAGAVRYLRVWAREGGHWRIVGGQVTVIPPDSAR